MINELGSGVTNEWLVENQLIRFTLPNSSRAAVDTYIQSNIDVITKHGTESTLFMVHDISSETAEFTPYLRARLEEISSLVGERGVNIVGAIVVKNDLTGQVMRLFGRVFTSRAGTIQQTFFTSMERAESWMEQRIAKGLTTSSRNREIGYES